MHVPVQYDERDKQMDKLKKAAYEDEIKRMRNGIHEPKPK
jgi:hypothetical protein